MLEVCVPYEIVMIYYTILSATWKFKTLKGGGGKSVCVKAYCSELLKILWCNFGNVLSLVYILCDSIYKDIGQFKSGLPISLFDFNCSFNQLYTLFRSEVGWNLKNYSKGASGWFILFWYFYSQTLINWMRTMKKMIYFMGRCWETAESNRDCRIIILFFIRKIYFLLTSNLFVIKTEYFQIQFWCPFSNAIIGFKKLLNFVCNLKAKKIMKISIFSPKGWFL